MSGLLIFLCLLSVTISSQQNEDLGTDYDGETILNFDITGLAPQKLTEISKSLIPHTELQLSALNQLWNCLEFPAEPRFIAVNRSELQEEGRVKKEKKKLLKYIKYIVVALITAAIVLIPIKLKLIAWVAASAFLIGKVALLLASIVGLKTLVSKTHEEKTYVYAENHRIDQAHNLAYGGYELPADNSMDY